MNVLGAIFAIVGGGAVIGGLVWHFVEPVSHTRASLIVLPVLAAGYGGVGFTATF
jgi:hypothetical protein